MGETKVTYICHDCHRELEENEEFMPYNTPVGQFIKCKACHIEDSVLRNYRPTEIYSRIVGYIRPVQTWNKGKSEEFKDRKVFKVDNPRKREE